MQFRDGSGSFEITNDGVGLHAVMIANYVPLRGVSSQQAAEDVSSWLNDSGEKLDI